MEIKTEIEKLNNFKTIKILYGNTFAMTIEQLEDIQEAVEILLQELERLQKECASKEKAYNDCYCEYKHYKQFESIPKKKIEGKIEELNEGIKRDMKNYDKVREESWKKAIHRSMTQKNESKKILQQLLEEK